MIEDNCVLECNGVQWRLAEKMVAFDVPLVMDSLREYYEHNKSHCAPIHHVFVMDLVPK